MRFENLPDELQEQALTWATQIAWAPFAGERLTREQLARKWPGFRAYVVGGRIAVVSNGDGGFYVRALTGRLTPVSPIKALATMRAAIQRDNR